MPSSYTLGGHFDGFVKDMVDSGRYASASEVVRDGLRLLEEREQLRSAKLAALRSEISTGLASGASTTLDIEEIKKSAREAKQARTPYAG
jgi:antitoxin ParD1/3/4